MAEIFTFGVYEVTKQWESLSVSINLRLDVLWFIPDDTFTKLRRWQREIDLLTYNGREVGVEAEKKFALVVGLIVGIRMTRTPVFVDGGGTNKEKATLQL